jgi:D,D-heptose 1,7-bisphosphate phosphatase
MDIGTADRLMAAEDALRRSIPAKRNMKNKQCAVFFDRDGTVTKYNGLIYDPDQLQLESGAANAIRRLNNSEFLSVLATNQSVVARGLCSETELAYIHNRLETLLGYESAYFDILKYCPHHPDKGYPEENSDYKVQCRCRKPGTALFEQCAEQYNIDLGNSWIIGDTTTDIQAGLNAGMRTILLRTGLAGSDGKYNATPDYICDSLEDSVGLILGNGMEN